MRGYNKGLLVYWHCRSSGARCRRTGHSILIMQPWLHQGCIIAWAWPDGRVEKERVTWERGEGRRKGAFDNRTAPRGNVAHVSTTASPQLFQIQMFVLARTCDLSCCAGASSFTATSYVFLCHLTCTDTVAGLSVAIVTILSTLLRPCPPPQCSFEVRSRHSKTDFFNAEPTLFFVPGTKTNLNFTTLDNCRPGDGVRTDKTARLLVAL